MTTETKSETLYLHHIEERSVVWLRLNDDGTGWEIDSPSDDGYPLEGYDNGPLHECCDYCDELAANGDSRADEAAIEGNDLAADYQGLPDLPTLTELYHIIGKYLGEV